MNYNLSKRYKITPNARGHQYRVFPELHTTCFGFHFQQISQLLSEKKGDKFEFFEIKNDKNQFKMIINGNLLVYWGLADS